MSGLNGNVDDLVEQTIANRPTHADQLAGMADDNGDRGVGQTRGGGFLAPRREPCGDAQASVIVNRGNLEGMAITAAHRSTYCGSL